MNQLETRAERTGYAETSRYDDVVGFFRGLVDAGAAIHVASIGRTSEGREIPLVVASRPLVRNAAEAKRLGRPIVYVQGNIHAGEVEGKEALQALVRDLARESGPNVLDAIVLVAVPIYNPDGNERFAPQARNRPEQNGPELVGERTNGRGLDLNRDYVKAEAEETRASLAAWREWDPDVFVDLHTTDGSLHGYALTYSPSLSQAALTTDGAARKLLDDLRARMRSRHGLEVFPYGNFFKDGSQMDVVDPNAAGGVIWKSYDGRPRFGTNYYGLRGRIAVLVEAYSHDPFERRVASTKTFLGELLDYVAAHAAEVSAVSRRADDEVKSWADNPAHAPDIGIRGRITAERREEDVLVEIVERVGAGARAEPGLPAGIRRTGKTRAVRMPVVDRFEPALVKKMPRGYAVTGDAAREIAPMLELHGIAVERVPRGATLRATVRPFVVDGCDAGPSFQGHRVTTLRGHEASHEVRDLGEDTLIVRTAQPLGLLAMYLLEPESDDGLVTWNFFDAWLAPGREFPVLALLDVR